MKAGGASTPRCGWIQRISAFEAGHAARVGKVHHRLVEQGELALRHALANLAQQLEPLLDRPAHRGLEGDYAVPAGVFRLVQSDVGVLQQLGGAGHVALRRLRRPRLL